MVKEYDNEMIPIEIKTGSAPKEGIWPSDRLQLGAYMVILKYKGKNVKKGIVKYIDHDEERILQMNPFLKEDVLKKISEVMKVLKGPLPKHVENKNKCNSCELKPICYDDERMERLCKRWAARFEIKLPRKA